MKIIMLFISAIFTLSANAACVDVVGNYSCPKADVAGGQMDIGDFSIKKSSITDVYSVKNNEFEAIFEIDTWSPMMTPSTGDIEFTVETMAKCEQDSVDFKLKVNQDYGDISIDVTSNYSVKPTEDGMELKISIESDDDLNMDLTTVTCVRK